MLEESDVVDRLRLTEGHDCHMFSQQSRQRERHEISGSKTLQQSLPNAKSLILVMQHL
jgi:hypothetical protein